MKINPNHKGPNADEAGKRLGLSSEEKKWAEKYAQLIVDQVPDLSLADEIVKEVRESIKVNNGDFLKDEERIGLIAEGAYEAALEFKTGAIVGEISNLEIADKKIVERFHGEKVKRDDQIAKEKQRELDRFARLMPKSTLNPAVGSELLEGNYTRAFLGGKHKLGRAIALRSPSAFNLKTKEQKGSNSKDTTGEMVGLISENQFSFARNSANRLENSEKIQAIAELLNGIEANKKVVKDKLDQLKKDWVEISNEAEDVYDALEDYNKMIQLMNVEADQARGHGVDRAAGKLYEGYRKLSWTNKAHPIYENAFNGQASLEQKIMRFETELKAILEIDLGDSPVAMNRNADSLYSAETTTLREFEGRQKHLNNRIEFVRSLFTEGKNALKDWSSEMKRDEEATKMHKKDLESRNRAIDKIARKWKNVETPNLEKLFWHEFGAQVALIREWQAQLPEIGRMGKKAYISMTTGICKEYEQLKAQILKLEELHNSGSEEESRLEELGGKGKFKGLTAILERELGLMNTNPFNENSKIVAMREELQQVQTQLRREKEVLEGEIEDRIELVRNYGTILEGLKKKSP